MSTAAPGLCGSPALGASFCFKAAPPLIFAARRASYESAAVCTGHQVHRRPRSLWEARPRGELLLQSCPAAHIRREARLLRSAAAYAGHQPHRRASPCGRPALGAKLLLHSGPATQIRREARLLRKRCGLCWISAPPPRQPLWEPRPRGEAFASQLPRHSHSPRGAPPTKALRPVLEISLTAATRPLWEARPRGEAFASQLPGRSYSPRGAPPTKALRPSLLDAMSTAAPGLCGRPALGAKLLLHSRPAAHIRREARLLRSAAACAGNQAHRRASPCGRPASGRSFCFSVMRSSRAGALDLLAVRSCALHR